MNVNAFSSNKVETINLASSQENSSIVDEMEETLSNEEDNNKDTNVLNELSFNIATVIFVSGFVVFLVGFIKYNKNNKAKKKYCDESVKNFV